ncbi:MAG: hypothetical protein RLZZ352_1527 [Pseudomonadota bacterium]|jgi:predicted nucleic acid-binding protein
MSRGFLLDTTVLSELMRAMPAPEVLEWFAGQSADRLNTSVITQAEILAGIAFLPEGKRRNALAAAAATIFEEDFDGRCLNFDRLAAGSYAKVRAQRQRDGRPIDTPDAQIAAIALAHGLCLVTRNTKDFAGIAGLSIVNPWQTH